MLFSRFNKLARNAFVVFLPREHHEHGGRGRFLSSAPIYLQPSAPFFIAFFLLRSPPPPSVRPRVALSPPPTAPRPRGPGARGRGAVGTRGGGAEGGGGGRGGAGNGGQRINLRGGRWFVTSLRHSWNSAHPDNVSEVWTCPIVSMRGGPLGKVVCSAHPIGCRSVLTASLFAPSVEADLRHGAISIEKHGCQILDIARERQSIWHPGTRYFAVRGGDEVSGTRARWEANLQCAQRQGLGRGLQKRSGNLSAQPGAGGALSNLLSD